VRPRGSGRLECFKTAHFFLARRRSWREASHDAPGFPTPSRAGDPPAEFIGRLDSPVLKLLEYIGLTDRVNQSVR